MRCPRRLGPCIRNPPRQQFADLRAAQSTLPKLIYRCQAAVLTLRAMSTSVQPEQMRSAMAETNERFCAEVFGKRNFEALDEIYTSPARILPPGAPMISGRKAIKEFWSNMVRSTNAKSAVLESIDVMPAGDGAVEIGRAVLVIEPGGQAASQLEVKYVVYWQQEDGRWKWHVDIWNPNS
jgi:ketosteroid isomerase-like protein